MRLVLIEWVDSSLTHERWTRLDDARPDLGVVRSVGWLHYDGADCKQLIAHHIAETETVAEQGCGGMTIPSCAIRRMVDLTEAS